VVISASHTLTKTTASSSSTSTAASCPTNSRADRGLPRPAGPHARIDPPGQGRARRQVAGAVQEFCMSVLPQGTDLSGLKVVIDCANGAATRWRPGPHRSRRRDHPLGCSPNGAQHQPACGSTSPGLIQATVSGVHADVGIALDGDGDRLVMVDHLAASPTATSCCTHCVRPQAHGHPAGPVVAP